MGYLNGSRRRSHRAKPVTPRVSRELPMILRRNLNRPRPLNNNSEGQEAGVSPEETSSAAAAQAENGCCFFPLSPATATPHITTSEEIEKAAKVADGVDKEERRRRFLEIKLAKEKAQRHLESLVQKKREKEDEVRLTVVYGCRALLTTIPFLATFVYSDSW